MVSVVSDGPFQQQRLDSWKSIARYLDRSCRTVQRWDSEYGLPIRHLGGKKSPIFAYSVELDDWMRNRGRTVTISSPEVLRPALLHAPLIGDESDHRNGILDSSLISSPEKARSAELVALAYRMWESLSCSSREGIIRLFREAIDLDPGNGEAFAGLSYSLIAQGVFGNVSAPAAYTAAEAALQRAVEINPELPETKCATAWLRMVSARDWQGARRDFDEAFKDRPSDAYTIVGRAALHIAEGYLNEASALLLNVVKLNPLRTLPVALYCWSKYLAGEYAKALDQVAQARAIGQFGPIFDAVEALASIQIEEPDESIPRMEALSADSPHCDVLQGALGYAYGVAGQGQRASEILEVMAHREAHGKMHEPYAAALVLIGLNQKPEAVKWLEQSYGDGSLWSLGFPSDPILAPLRNDPHYRLFLSKVSYPVPGNANPRLGSLCTARHFAA